MPDLPLDAVTSTPSSPTKQQFTASNNGNTLYEIKNPVPGSAKLATAVRGEDVERAGDCDGAAGDDERTSHKLEDEFPFLQAKTVQGEFSLEHNLGGGQTIVGGRGNSRNNAVNICSDSSGRSHFQDMPKLLCDEDLGSATVSNLYK